MFTKPEKRLIDENYFDIIMETEDYIEFKSKNTDHCWIIKKIKYTNTKKMCLYHKHSIEERYYHQHYEALTVKQVIDNIKGHDEYVLKIRLLEKSILK